MAPVMIFLYFAALQSVVADIAWNYNDLHGPIVLDMDLKHSHIAIAGGLAPLRYAVFGDSWASGLNYGPPSDNMEYDFPDSDEVCRCRRVNEAWPVQLLRDENLSWTGWRPLELDFQACHGAGFGDIADQVRRLDQEKAPDFGFLMIGGNPGGFFNIIENCVYQENRDKDYGPEYPNPDGECFKALTHAQKTIKSLWFIRGIWDSIFAILNEPRIRRNRQFRLFVVSYSGLFNHDDEKCNDWSFGIWGGKQPKLTTSLRRHINLVIDEGRLLYDRFINRIMFNPKVRFIDVNSVLGGHRFCEPTSEGTIQAQNANSWLWDLEWPGCWPFESDKDIKNSNVTGQWPAFCRNCGGIGELGELQRPFHPKKEGHKAIKNFLKAAIRQEFYGMNWIDEKD